MLTATALGGAPYALNAAPVVGVHPIHYLMLMAIGLVACGIGIGVMQMTAWIERAFESSPLPKWARPAVGGLPECASRVSTWRTVS